MKTLLLFCTMLISISAFTQEKQFNKACKKHTIESYEKFINKFPNSEFTEEAEYKKVEIVNTSTAYEHYLKEYPKGEFSSKAENCLCKLEYFKIEKNSKIELFKTYLKRFSDCEDYNAMAKKTLIMLEYQNAEEINTLDAYEYFLKEYTANEFINQAENNIQKLEFENAKKENTIMALNIYIEKYPESSFTKLAKKRIEEIDFNKAKALNSINAYNNYLQKYPKGIFQKKAEKAIEKIDFNKTKDSVSIEALQNYIIRYPHSYFKKDAENAINDIIKKFNKTDFAQIKKGVNIIAKTDTTYYNYKIGAMKQIPAKINIISKSNLKYYTKVINGYIGDVKLTDKEITEVINLLSKAVKSSINITTDSSSEYQLLVVINSSAPYTYMDNRGYPWSGIKGSLFLINSNKKLLFNYGEIDIRGKELNATIKKFAEEVALKFNIWTKQ